MRPGQAGCAVRCRLTAFGDRGLATWGRAAAAQALQRHWPPTRNAQTHGGAPATERQGTGAVITAAGISDHHLARRHQRDTERALRGSSVSAELRDHEILLYGELDAAYSRPFTVVELKNNRASHGPSSARDPPQEDNSALAASPPLF